MSDDLQGTIPLVDASVVDRWDKEWMHYLSTESKWPHLIQSSKLRVQTDVRHLERAEIFATSLTMTADAIPMAPLRIWATGSELVQRSVAEIGCGAGFLGKQIGLIATRYLGIDVSQLALAIARGNSGPNCSYLHIGERTLIAQEFGKYDTVLGREFFIHQNFPNAMQVLRLAKELLVGVAGYVPTSICRIQTSNKAWFIQPAPSSTLTMRLVRLLFQLGRFKSSRRTSD
ncbi:class I SAM-dependent methyltransferase [Bradyrhizobium sp. 6(2017)]|uniref:class I SAM-dependent methyltransferase n=1 Tax=Bradyrhizobium sp. 6(2017) TaxID=1197460 RepID=UPI002FE5CE39